MIDMQEGQKGTMSTWLKAAGYLTIALSILLVAGMLSVSYSGTLYLLIGVLVAWLIRFINTLIHDLLLTKISRLKVIIISLVIISIVIGLLTISGLPPGPLLYKRCTPGETTLRTKLTEYHAIVEPVDFSQGAFKVLEQVTCDVKEYVCNADYTTSVSTVEEGTELSFPERDIYGSSRGIFLREVQMTPLHGTTLSDSTCCPEITTVELRDFPRGSFYVARDVHNLELSPYLDSETIRWSQSYLGSGVVFAYLASPFHILRHVLAPFIEVSYQSQWLVALFGLIATAVVAPIVKPAIMEIGKNRLRSLLGEKPSKQTRKEVELVVSGRGEVKTIEVKDEKPE